MKLICNLNSLTYLNDLKEMAVAGLFVGNDEISSRHGINLSWTKIEELTSDFQVFVMLNQLYDEKDLPLIETWILKIRNSNVFGIVFQDFAVLSLCQQYGLKQVLMYMPETLNTNAATINDLAALGIQSAFLAREIPLTDITAIADRVQIPLCLQLHGVMYMASSKRHLLSNYAKANHLTLAATPYLLQAQSAELKAWVWEDRFGTQIVSQSELCSIEYLATLNHRSIAWGMIDCLFMDEYRALEVVNIYQDALQALANGQYLRDVHHFKRMLNDISKSQPLSGGFYENATVYKLSDVRVMDDEKRNQSDH